MEPVNLGGNLSQVSEVARLHRAGDHLDEQGRRAQAEDALREALRRREQVERTPESRHGRVDRQGRDRAGDDRSPGRRPHRRPDSAGSRTGDAGSPASCAEDDPRGRVLDVRV